MKINIIAIHKTRNKMLLNDVLNTGLAEIFS